MKCCSLHLCWLHTFRGGPRQRRQSNFAVILADAAGAEADSYSNLVAPLLQRVAADVLHYVKSHGYTRMPTRGEMREEGGSRGCDACPQIAVSTVFSPACLPATFPMQQAVVVCKMHRTASRMHKTSMHSDVPLLNEVHCPYRQKRACQCGHPLWWLCSTGSTPQIASC